jgi:hypothetical protein
VLLCQPPAKSDQRGVQLGFSNRSQDQTKAVVQNSIMALRAFADCDVWCLITPPPG